ncbi:MAG: hypothetical protein Q7L55_05695 [Actinomycetota bacterium]|nr:hypothetical protein [Actinomycetota bacterium]
MPDKPAPEKHPQPDGEEVGDDIPDFGEEQPATPPKIPIVNNDDTQ